MTIATVLAEVYMLWMSSSASTEIGGFDLSCDAKSDGGALYQVMCPSIATALFLGCVSQLYGPLGV